MIPNSETPNPSQNSDKSDTDAENTELSTGDDRDAENPDVHRPIEPRD